jgi:hypothetical protein
VSALGGDIKLPGLGPVPKKWFLIVGGGSVIVIGYVIIRRKKDTGTAAAGTTDAGTAALAGQPCVDANGNPGVYDDSGTCQVDTSALGGYYAGTGALGTSGVTAPVPGTGGFTTNGQWSQQAVMDMQSLGTAVDVGTLTAALGAYINGQPVTPDQMSLIDQARAIEGDPPVAGPSGYPPAVKLQASTGQTTPPPTPGTPAKPPTSFSWTSNGKYSLNVVAMSHLTSPTDIITLTQQKGAYKAPFSTYVGKKNYNALIPAGSVMWIPEFTPAPVHVNPGQKV